MKAHELITRLSALHPETRVGISWPDGMYAVLVDIDHEPHRTIWVDVVEDDR